MNLSQMSPRSRDGLVSFLVAAVLLMLAHWFHGVTRFPWDSEVYWALSAPEVFFHYPKGIRGYFYPLLLLPAHFLSNNLPGYELYPYRIISSVAFGYVLTNTLPSLYVHLFGGQLSLARRMVLPALVLILFPGLIIYPLSDLPAFILFISAIHFAFKIRSAGSIRAASAWALLAGVFSAASYNTRTIYLFPLAFLVLAIPFYVLADRSMRQRGLAVAAFVVGIVVVSVPQSIINHNTQGSWSPAVIAQRTEKSLFALQLMWGITMQRYETSIDPAAPAPSRYFLDGAGERLFAKAKLEESDVTIASYLALVLQYPMEFLGIYGRHLVNGLDLRDGEVYINDVTASSQHIAVFNFLVLCAGLFVALMRFTGLHSLQAQVKLPVGAYRVDAQPAWPAWLLLWLLPVIAILPGAIETRFFLPLHLLVYCTLAFHASFDEAAAFIKKYWGVLCCGVVLLGAFYFAVSTATMSSLAYSIPPVYRLGQ